MNKKKKIEGILINAIKRGKRNQRGLKITSPDSELADSHIEKSRHNLRVMQDLFDLNHSDWVVVVAYYAMYHAAMAILSKIGLESKDHATTVAILEYFFTQEINYSSIEKFNELKNKKDNLEQLQIEEKYINYLWKAKNLREKAQYGTNTFVARSNEVLDQAKEFLLTIRMLVGKINDEYTYLIQQEIKKISKH